jgi:very-short-patch-repair endonuclease
MAENKRVGEDWSFESLLSGLDINGEDEPLFESPIEEILYEKLTPWLRDDVDLITQVEVPTEKTVFRLDLLLRCPQGRSVAIECDGRQHILNYKRDEWRDKQILLAKGCDAIYRVSGSNIWNYPLEVVHLLAKSEPNFFGSRIHAVTGKLRGSAHLNSNLPGWFEYELIPEIEGHTPHTILLTRLPHYRDQIAVHDGQGGVAFKNASRS